MGSVSESSKEDLIETIDELKHKEEELMQKLRSLEGEQLKSNISNRQLEGKIKELKE